LLDPASFLGASLQRRHRSADAEDRGCADESDRGPRGRAQAGAAQATLIRRYRSRPVAASSADTRWSATSPAPPPDSSASSCSSVIAFSFNSERRSLVNLQTRRRQVQREQGIPRTLQAAAMSKPGRSSWRFLRSRGSCSRGPTGRPPLRLQPDISRFRTAASFTFHASLEL
jgi:hypothetical protein